MRMRTVPSGGAQRALSDEELEEVLQLRNAHVRKRATVVALLAGEECPSCGAGVASRQYRTEDEDLVEPRCPTCGWESAVCTPRLCDLTRGQLARFLPEALVEKVLRQTERTEPERSRGPRERT